MMVKCTYVDYISIKLKNNRNQKEKYDKTSRLLKNNKKFIQFKSLFKLEKFFLPK